MAVQRDHPYGNFNFLVDLGDGETTGPQAGFSEIVLPEAEIDVIEYRNGNEKESGVIKLPGRQRYDNVILKRGITGSLNLYQWWNQVRNGDVSARRTVTIQLQNEERGAVVMTWKLLRAWPAKYTGPHLLGKGNDVAIETLELAFERLELE
jgi:phage tail-like protein